MDASPPGFCDSGVNVRATKFRRRSFARIFLVILLYSLLSWAGFLPGSLRFFHDWLLWFEDPMSCYRIWWFSELIYGGREGSIWFLSDLLHPFGIPTMMQSNGLGRELVYALLGGGLCPWLTGNIYSLSVPVTVGLTGFLALRARLRGAFLPALVGGWYLGWSGLFIGHMVSPWIASNEGLILFLYALMRMRSGGRLIRWSVVAGVAAALAAWLQIQQMVYVAVLSVVFLVDRWIARDWKPMGALVLSGVIAALLSARLLLETWVAFDGRLEEAGGAGFDEAMFKFRNRVSQFLLPPASSLPLGPLSRLVASWWPDHGPGGVAYLGWGLLVMAFIGWRTRRKGTGFLAALFLVSVLLSFGPVISLGFSPDENAPIFGSSWIPGPFYFLRKLPLMNSMRVPCRFIAPAEAAAGFLAAHGVLHVLRKPWLKQRRWRRWAFAAFLLLLNSLEIRAWPFRFAPPQYSPFYEEVAREPGDFAILDYPYVRGMHQYVHYGAYHEKKVIWGFGSRVPVERFEALERDFAFPGIVMVYPGKWDADYERFARSLIRYRVRYVFMHELHLNYNDEARRLRAQLLPFFDREENWGGQDWIEPPRLVYNDEVLRVYEILPRAGGGRNPP